MAHYAFLDENNIVTEVIVGRNENEIVDGISDWESFYGELRGQVCKRTSYNSNIRKNFAGVGYSYDSEKDVFIPPKPYNSWILDEDTYTWKPPFSQPESEEAYTWSEETLSWNKLL